MLDKTLDKNCILGEYFSKHRSHSGSSFPPPLEAVLVCLQNKLRRLYEAAWNWEREFVFTQSR